MGCTRLWNAPMQEGVMTSAPKSCTFRFCPLIMATCRSAIINYLRADFYASYWMFSVLLIISERKKLNLVLQVLLLMRCVGNFSRLTFPYPSRTSLHSRRKASGPCDAHLQPDCKHPNLRPAYYPRGFTYSRSTCLVGKTAAEPAMGIKYTIQTSQAMP
jgi:hypothetical protein